MRFVFHPWKYKWVLTPPEEEQGHKSSDNVNGSHHSKENGNKAPSQLSLSPISTISQLIHDVNLEVTKIRAGVSLVKEKVDSVSAGVEEIIVSSSSHIEDLDAMTFRDDHHHHQEFCTEDEAESIKTSSSSSSSSSSLSSLQMKPDLVMDLLLSDVDSGLELSLKRIPHKYGKPRPPQIPDAKEDGIFFIKHRTSPTKSPSPIVAAEDFWYSKWKRLFDLYDREGFGEILWPDFFQALRTPLFREAVGEGKVQLLAHLGLQYSTHTNAITFQCFLNIMSGKRSRSFTCAVHHRDREVSSENDFHISPTPSLPPIKRMAKLIAQEFLTEERDRKYYADHYKCRPPPLFIILLTLLQIGAFSYYFLQSPFPSSGVPGSFLLESPLIYRPDRRVEVWRFLSYAVLHTGWIHLIFNLAVQLLVGLPLEMVHGSVRIGIIYIAGVLAGSLGSSVLDPHVCLVGASGGVYALLAAHLANVLLNYNNMEFGILRLVAILSVASVDVGFAIFDRYASAGQVDSDIGQSDSDILQPSALPIAYVAHLMGALAGLSLGLVVLKNFEQRLKEQLIWWVALGLYATATVFAILYNVFKEEAFKSPEFTEVGVEDFPFPPSSILLTMKEQDNNESSKSSVLTAYFSSIVKNRY